MEAAAMEDGINKHRNDRALVPAIHISPIEPKQGFIRARLNKDNLWNLIFFSLFIIGFKIAYALEQPFGGMVVWATILGVPYLVKKNSGITCDLEKKQILDRNGSVLNNRAPNFALLVALTIGLTMYTGFITDGTKAGTLKTILGNIVPVIPILVPTLYCILKNFPIAAYFLIRTGMNTDTSDYKFPTWSKHNHNWQYYSLSKYYRPSNIHYHKRHQR